MRILIATVLDQFCAKIIACCLYPYTKCSSRGMKKISSIFRRSVLTMIFFNEFSRHLNKKHLVQLFQVSIHAYPRYPLPQTTKKQFQRLNIVFQNWTIIFGIQLKKIGNSMTWPLQRRMTVKKTFPLIISFRIRQLNMIAWGRGY